MGNGGMLVGAVEAEESRWVLDSKKFGYCLVESSLKKSTSVDLHVEGLRERERLRPLQ